VYKKYNLSIFQTSIERQINHCQKNHETPNFTQAESERNASDAPTKKDWNPKLGIENWTPPSLFYFLTEFKREKKEKEPD